MAARIKQTAKGTILPASLFNRATVGPAFVQARFGTARGLVRLWLAKAQHASGSLKRFADPDWEHVSRLVFVCAGNICRSPYAERRALMMDYPAASCGLTGKSGRPADLGARAAAAIRGISLEGHRSCNINDFHVAPGDLLVGMEPGQVQHLATLFGPRDNVQITLLGLWSRPRREHLADPYGLKPAYFGMCFDVIDSAVREMTGRLARKQS